MKKLLALLLVMALCIPCFGSIQFVASAATTHVYTIVTNPGENMNTQMNVSFHADPGYTGCYVEYTTANDTSFASAKKNYGTQDTDDYLWFYNRHTQKENTSSRYTTKFINYNVDLKDLSPNTDYIYRICDGQGGYSDTYNFKTAGQSKFSILWTSDMHLSANEPTKVNRFNATVQYLESIADYDIGLHFNTGDATASGERITFWQTMYNQPVFKKYTYAATVGNHDLYDSMMAGDELYTQYWKGGEYFRITANYPDNGFTQTSDRITGYLSGDGYSAHASKSSSQLFDPGTGSLAGKQITGAMEDLNGRTYWFIYNRVLFIVFDYYAQTGTNEINRAFAWANGVIEANKGKYDYLIASEHLNLLNGDSGANRYYNRYQAWLDSANVDVFLCGDNHIYFRSYPLVNGSKVTDPEKGTVMLQASAITNTTTYTSRSGTCGSTGAYHYSSANYLGGAVLNFDERGLTIESAVNSAGTASAADFKIVDTHTIPMKTRERVYEDAKTGYYTASSALTLKEISDASSQTLATIPSGTVFTVDTVSGNYGRVSYGGFTGWVNLSGMTPTVEASGLAAPANFSASNVNVGYASSSTLSVYTPAYGATIANGNWTFAYNRTITAVRDSTGAYKVTAQNTTNDAKNTTAIPENGVVLLISESYPQYASLMSTFAVGKYFTLDTGKVCMYPATPGAAYTPPTLPGTKYTLTVENGTGGGSYEAGTVVNIAPNFDVSGNVIVKNWVLVSGSGTFGNAASQSTTFTMGNSNATIRLETETLKELEVTTEAGNAGVKIENEVIKGVNEKLAYADFVAMFTTKVSVLDQNGNEADTAAPIGTGFIATNGYYNAVVLVVGDINSDAQVNSADFIAVKTYLKSALALSGVYVDACDFDSDGNVGTADIIAMTSSIAS